ncbi:MAG: hypothetical protein WCX16_01385 [Candidatus Omnitrophota bacterium]|jgi:hypothetical protein
MQIQLQKLEDELTRGFRAGFLLFLFVVMGAGCTTPKPPPEQGPYIKIQGGQDSGGVTWSK